jgi:photosystem II stability/assembly factor-like uncharacterized protein
MTAPLKYIFFLLILCTGILSQWIVVNQLNNLGQYPTISVSDCSTIVTAGGSGSTAVIYRSTNGGINFTNIVTTDINKDLYAVWAMNKDTIFVGDGGSPGGLGGNARVYRTTNGGINWVNVLSTGGNSGFIDGIVFQRPDNNFGIIVSDPPQGSDSFWVAKTTNKGNDWVITRAPRPGVNFTTQNSPFLVDSLFYGFGLQVSPGKIYMTTNGGINWTIRIIGLVGNSVPSTVFQSDKLNGISVSDNGLPLLAITTNGGANWQSYNTGAGTFGVGTTKWVPGTSIYYLAANKIKRTSNNGQSWEEMTTSGVQNFVHMDLILNGVNNICAYALASDGRVLKYEGEPFGLKQISGEVPTDFELKQNYPNPFNPITYFSFRIPENGFVTIRVFDVKGKDIQTLVNESLAPGIYEVEFDADNLPSGVYYYTLSSKGFVGTKKMVLVK